MDAITTASVRALRPIALVAAIVLAAGVTAETETLRGTCIRVPDADRVDVWLSTRDDVVSVRLAGIDAISLRETYHRYATVYIRDLVLGQPVTVEVHGRSDGGEVTGRVIVDHRDVSYLIISEGLALNDGTAPAGMRLVVAEEIARGQEAGFWAADSVESGEDQSWGTGADDLPTVAWQVDRRRALDPWPAPATDPEPEPTPDIDIRWGSWVGAHESTLVATWGPPTRRVADGRGGAVLVYDRCADALTPEDCRELIYVNDTGHIYKRDWDDGG